MSPGVPLAGIFFFFILGLIFGSFANVCIHRVPRGRSVAVPRSRCPRCYETIAWHENIPLVSWFWLRGRCAHCGRGISVRYVVVEFWVGILFATVFVRAVAAGDLFLGLFLTFVLVVITVIDLDWRIIPDVFSLGLLGVGLVTAPLNPLLGATGPHRLLTSLVGAAVGFGSAWAMAAAGRRVFGREALGGGDIKLLAGLGAFLGAPGLFTTWFVGSVLGSVIFLTLQLRRKVAWGSYIPFGPFLAAGAWAHWMWPRVFLAWWGVG